MNTLKRLSPLFPTNKNDLIYLSYKYEDIKPEWIIHEGNLEYLYDENIFKTSLFKKYFIVLTTISNGKNDNMIILYLYADKNKNPYKFFHLNQNDRYSDRCSKVTTAKSGLFFFELTLHDGNKGEIFGACSDPERKSWFQKFDQAISMLKTKTITRSASDIPSFRPGEKTPSGGGSHNVNYPSFNDDQNNHERPKSQPVIRSNSDSCVKPPSRPAKPPQINNYDEAKLILPGDIAENDEIPSNQSKTIFAWNEIYYNNEKNDFQSALNNNGKNGVFLIRPQPKKTNSNNQVYILCVYDSRHIYELEIHRLPNHRYVLTNHKNEPSFIDINHLCQYYTNHPLYVTSKDGSDKLVYLTYPYTQQYL